MFIDEYLDKFKEECGIFGIFSNEDANLSTLLYIALTSLQHRGQESCGVVVSNGKSLTCHKKMGLVSEVFSNKEYHNIKGKIAIGHVRYSTHGDSNINNAQPILDISNSKEMAIAHNGNLTNVNKYKNKLSSSGINFNTTTDSEVILKMIQYGKNNIYKNIIEIIKTVKGGYAILVEEKDKLIGFRDSLGIRPLCIGRLEDNYVLTSESCALDMIKATFIRDVAPGEIVVIDKNGLKSIKSSNKNNCLTCAFEYIYFAREDSIIDNVDVYQSRFLAGKELFLEQPVDADIIIGIPDSGIPAALGYSEKSGIQYSIGLSRNKYIGRTFILPTDEKRKKDLFIKFNVLRKNISGKRVIVIDDSIVRGTTSKEIVKQLRKAGAKEVHFRVASPVITNTCPFGINTKTKDELIGAKIDNDNIRNLIGADSLGYLSMEGFIKTLQGKLQVCNFCFK